MDFGEMTAAQAQRYPATWAHVDATVRPARERQDGSKYPRMVYEWWKFWNARPGLYRAIAGLEEVISLSRVTAAPYPQLVTNGVVFSDRVVVVATDSAAMLAMLNSNAHIDWCTRWGTTHETRFTYSISKGFETFPFLWSGTQLDALGRELHTTRSEAMLRRRLGLTALYNLVNSPEVQGDADVELIRSIHVRIDRTLIGAYGWNDIPLDHGFHTYRQMKRWTVSPAARVEILDRLLEENHRRAAIEAQQNPTKATRGKSLEESEKPEGAMF